ncbi:uncharacterized protein LOC133287511 isoform X2 [Gastrolobium bilobum]|uniref:uncharacterized protein LOC133287511 isoform X2 n=1 Tax=Gastrolobium bilobum TaxID=150636 RepID=UPI002AB01622|nr:uncharacterized protein LOC133287511 isoform X2 [Gastrolobium bilobum]
MDMKSSCSSSIIRHHSVNSSSFIAHQMDHDAESEHDLEAGAISDRALHSIRLSFDHVSEDGVVVSNPGVHKLQPYQDGASNSFSSIKPLTPELMTPLLSNEREDSEDIKQEPEKELPKLLHSALCLVHLAVFGILGD